MIVRRDEDGLLLITQPDHAALAADIMKAWRADDFPARRTRDLVLTATREHDNGWLEVDAPPAIDPISQQPYDFIGAPDEVKQGIWPRALDRLAARDPAVAALVAEHALIIFRRHRDHPTWREFFIVIEAARDRLLALARSRFDDFDRDYAIVFLGDLLSLIFCNGWTDAVDAHGYRVRLEGRDLHVTPDPFAGGRAAFSVRARRIPARAYADDDDLRAELRRAGVAALDGAAVGHP